jgi:hypothetical protein
MAGLGVTVGARTIAAILRQESTQHATNESLAGRCALVHSAQTPSKRTRVGRLDSGKAGDGIGVTMEWSGDRLVETGQGFGDLGGSGCGWVSAEDGIGRRYR